MFKGVRPGSLSFSNPEERKALEDVFEGKTEIDSINVKALATDTVGNESLAAVQSGTIPVKVGENTYYIPYFAKNP